MQSGVKAQDLSEGLVDSIRRTKVVMTEPEIESDEEELKDPMQVETEESYT